MIRFDMGAASCDLPTIVVSGGPMLNGRFREEQIGPGTHVWKFEDIDDYKARIDVPDLPVDETCVLVLKGCGPKGYPGFPETGKMGLPAKLLMRGVDDMVRISDARVSGTVVLHTAPEAAASGPLALVRDGGEIEFDVPARRLALNVSDEELERRHAAWQPPKPRSERGYLKLYLDHVMQADTGADLDILTGGSGAEVPRESH